MPVAKACAVTTSTPAPQPPKHVYLPLRSTRNSSKHSGEQRSTDDGGLDPAWGWPSPQMTTLPAGHGHGLAAARLCSTRTLGAPTYASPSHTRT